MKERIPVSRAVDQIKNGNNPQIIVWFSNYFGSVMEGTCAWYRENIFNKMSQGTFWLTDLKAWSFLSVDKEQLKKNYPALVEKIERIQQNKVAGVPELNKPEMPIECPLITKSSDVIDKELPSRYKPLISKEFFQWLLSIKDREILPDVVCNKLLREYPRADGLRFSLADIGYKPDILNRAALLEADFSIVYPVLQYLEGMYYAYKVIENSIREGNRECSIVFMLPNKEFTYYTVPGESALFANFRQGVDCAIKSLPAGSVIKVGIRFQPFAYGSDFYDAPYKFTGKKDGNRLKKNELMKRLIQ